MTKVSERPCSLDLTTMNFNVPIAKTLWLAMWVKTHLQETHGGLIPTSQMFHSYLRHTANESKVTEAQFIKMIEPLMRAFGSSVFKARTEKGRGYSGIAFRNHLNPGSSGRFDDNFFFSKDLKNKKRKKKEQGKLDDKKRKHKKKKK